MARKLIKLHHKFLLVGVAIVTAFAMSACGGGGGGGGGSGTPAPPDGGQAVTVNSVALSGRQITAASGGPVITNASGSGTLTVSADRTAITFTLDAGALATFNSPVITGAHIHVRNPGEDNGPIIFDFLPPPVNAPDPLVLSGTLTAADLAPRPPNVPDFPAAVDAVLSGTTYFQVHTEAHPGGELRGHIGPETLASTLDGAQITPGSGGPVITNATGSGEVTINSSQDSVSVLLDMGLAANFNGTIVAAHIHEGGLGLNGDIIFDFPLPAVIPANPVINVVLTAADLIPRPPNVPDFPSAVDALLSGNTYFQVHTTVHPGGEIRGQIFPVR